MKNIEVSVDLLEANEAHQAGKDPFSAEGKAIPNDDGEEPTPTASTVPLMSPIGSALREPPTERIALLKTSKGKLFVPRGKVGLLAAAGGAGKTFTIGSLAVAIATGRDWFGFQVPEPGAVLLALGEENMEEIHRRLYYICKNIGLSNDEYELAGKNIYPMSLCGYHGAQLIDEKGNQTQFARNFKARLEEIAKQNKLVWHALLLDPAARFMSLGSETDNSLATKFVVALEHLTDIAGEPTVLAAHHTRKTARDGKEVDMNAARGASALVDGVRFMLTLGPNEDDKKKKDDPNVIYLSCEKSNYGARGEPVKLIRKAHGVLELAGGQKKANRDVGES